MRVLVVLSRFPWPLDKGDKLRAYYQIKELAKNHDIYLFCVHVGKRIEKEQIEAIAPLVSDMHIHRIPKWLVLWRLFLGLFNQRPFQVSYFHGKGSQEVFDRFVEKHIPDAIYCQLIRTAEYARKYAVTNKVLDYMDAFSLGFQRRLQKASFYEKPFVWLEKQRLEQYENTVFSLFEHKTIIAERDRKAIQHQNAKEISIIPNGISAHFLKPTEENKKYDLLFTGNMSYPPNVDAAKYIAEQILPLILKTRPETTVMIAGTNPTRTVRSLASKNVTVSGWLPDLKKVYDQSRVFVAPMFMGSGLQNKLLEAMACGIPTVTTPIAQTPLGASEGEHLSIASTPETFSQHILHLLKHPEQSKKMGQNGRTFVEQQFSWEQTTAKLAKLLQQRKP